MNAITITPTILSTIKGTAMSKNKARILIQRTDLAQYGFPLGQRINIAYLSDSIVITVDDDGARKVAKVTDNRRNVQYQTLDIKLDAGQRAAMFNGSARLTVWASTNQLMVTI